MNNEIAHKTLVIELDIWAPFQKQGEKDIDELVHKLRVKELLKHCGNVVLRFE